MEAEDKSNKIGMIPKEETKAEQTELTSKEGEDKLEQATTLKEEEDKSEQVEGTSEVKEEDESSEAHTISFAKKIYFGFKATVGLTALLTGVFYINTHKEYCPWSPNLPTFLLIYGISHLSSLAIALLIYWLCKFLVKKTKIFYIILGIDIGLVIWGLFLLYSPLEEASYTEYYKEDNVTYVRNENYCSKVIYIVSMAVMWKSVALYTFKGLLYCCYYSAMSLCISCLLNNMKAKGPDSDDKPESTPCIMEKSDSV